MPGKETENPDLSMREMAGVSHKFYKERKWSLKWQIYFIA